MSDVIEDLIIQAANKTRALLWLGNQNEYNNLSFTKNSNLNKYKGFINNKVNESYTTLGNICINFPYAGNIDALLPQHFLRYEQVDNCDQHAVLFKSILYKHLVFESKSHCSRINPYSYDCNVVIFTIGNNGHRYNVVLYQKKKKGANIASYRLAYVDVWNGLVILDIYNEDTESLDSTGLSTKAFLDYYVSGNLLQKIACQGYNHVTQTLMRSLTLELGKFINGKLDTSLAKEIDPAWFANINPKNVNLTYINPLALSLEQSLLSIARTNGVLNNYDANASAVSYHFLRSRAMYIYSYYARLGIANVLKCSLEGSSYFSYQNVNSDKVKTFILDNVNLRDSNSRANIKKWYLRFSVRSKNLKFYSKLQSIIASSVPFRDTEVLFEDYSLIKKFVDSYTKLDRKTMTWNQKDLYRTASRDKDIIQQNDKTCIRVFSNGDVRSFIHAYPKFNKIKA